MAVMFLDFLVMFKLIHCLEKAFGLRGPVESSSCKGRICLLHPWPRPGFQGWQLRDSNMTEFHRMFFFFFRTTTKNIVSRKRTDIKIIKGTLLATLPPILLWHLAEVADALHCTFERTQSCAAAM